MFNSTFCCFFVINLFARFSSSFSPQFFQQITDGHQYSNINSVWKCSSILQFNKFIATPLNRASQQAGCYPKNGSQLTISHIMNREEKLLLMSFVDIKICVQLKSLCKSILIEAKLDRGQHEPQKYKYNLQFV